MKKILALLLASLLVISLFAGCAKQTNDTMKKTSSPPPTAKRRRKTWAKKDG
ncbi:MAG: hypothetical protein ACLU3I_18220 [Acutalibacteraceae bacterium]